MHNLCSLHCSNCLAKALFERAHVVERSGVTHGAVEYGKALRLLGWIIQDPTVCYGPENIVANLLLNLYKMVIFTNHHGWIQPSKSLGISIKIYLPTFLDFSKMAI